MIKSVLQKFKFRHKCYSSTKKEISTDKREIRNV